MANKKDKVTDKKVVDDKIKKRFLVDKGTDKFTKVEEYETVETILDGSILAEYNKALAGSRDLLASDYERRMHMFKVTRMTLSFNLIYRKKSNEDIFISKISFSQFNITEGVTRMNALKEGKITFLFDDDSTIVCDKEITYNGGIENEELFIETNISLLSKIVNSKSVEYRLQSSFGVISEGSFYPESIINFCGFYNSLFDNSFKRDEIISAIEKEEKEEKARKRREAQEKKKELEKEKELEIKNTSSNSSCFVVTATMDDVNHPTVKDFRLFRDNFLLTNNTGKYFIDIYYKLGPYFAKIISLHPILQKLSYSLFIKPIHNLIRDKIDTYKN